MLSFLPTNAKHMILRKEFGPLSEFASSGTVTGQSFMEFPVLSLIGLQTFTPLKEVRENRKQWPKTTSRWKTENIRKLGVGGGEEDEKESFPVECM